MIGQTVSHYKILEKLGEGGMGEVYLAEDTSLGRKVAVKFLSADKASDPESRQRFVHEARAQAMLSHPNIATFYEVGEEGDKVFIVMEYIEGQPLSRLAQNEKLSFSEILDIAIQIGEGLSAAHERGITHRDIKPENVLVNSKRLAKITDFGLAKWKGATTLTQSGTRMGTAYYMSPEQVDGRKADQRTDIFSLGVVLYELFCARRPFEGDTETAVFYELVHTPPQPLARYCRNLPEGLERIVFKCLSKKPEERYQHADELVADLKTLKRSSDIDLLPSYIQTSSDKHKKARAKRLKLMGAAAVLVLVGAVTILLFLRNNNRPIELNPNMTFRTLEIPFTQVGRPGMSADGNWISFAAVDANGKWDVYFANTTGGEPRRITFDSATWFGVVDVSPDGNQIIYTFYNAQINKTETRIVSSLGGASRTIASPASAAIWRPDGGRIGYSAGVGFNAPSQSGKLEFRSVKPDGSDDRLEFLDSLGQIGWFAWSPDGKELAVERVFSPREQDIFVRELATGKERQLTFFKSDIAGLCWSKDGNIIFSSNKSGSFKVWMVPAAGGPAVQITKGVGTDFASKISADCRKLIYYQLQPAGQLWIAKLDGSGAQPIPGELGFRQLPYFSPDGKQIAFTMVDPDNITVTHAYTINRNGTGRLQISFGNEQAGHPRWSPDGKWIAYNSFPNSEPLDSAKIYLVEAANPGKPKLIGRGRVRKWLNSERLVAFTSTNSWMVYTDGRAQEKIYRDSTWGIPKLKGKYILFQDLHTDHAGWWWIVPTDSSKGSQTAIPKKVALSNLPYSAGPEDDIFVYVKNDGEIWKVHLPELREERIPGNFPGLTFASDINASYDGKEVIYVDKRTTGKLVMIENPFK